MMPLPKELATPPVTKMYFVSMLCEIELFNFMRKYNNDKELQNKTRRKAYKGFFNDVLCNRKGKEGSLKASLVRQRFTTYPNLSMSYNQHKSVRPAKALVLLLSLDV